MQSPGKCLHDLRTPEKACLASACMTCGLLERHASPCPGPGSGDVDEDKETPAPAKLTVDRLFRATASNAAQVKHGYQDEDIAPSMNEDIALHMIEDFAPAMNEDIAPNMKHALNLVKGEGLFPVQEQQTGEEATATPITLNGSARMAEDTPLDLVPCQAVARDHTNDTPSMDMAEAATSGSIEGATAGSNEAIASGATPNGSPPYRQQQGHAWRGHTPHRGCPRGHPPPPPVFACCTKRWWSMRGCKRCRQWAAMGHRSYLMGPIGEVCNGEQLWRGHP